MDTNMGDSFFLGRSRERECLGYAGTRSTCCGAICGCCSAPEAAAFIAGRFAQGAWHIKILITVCEAARSAHSALARGRRARIERFREPGTRQCVSLSHLRGLGPWQQEFGTAEARALVGAAFLCAP